MFMVEPTYKEYRKVWRLRKAYTEFYKRLQYPVIIIIVFLAILNL